MEAQHRSVFRGRISQKMPPPHPHFRPSSLIKSSLREKQPFERIELKDLQAGGPHLPTYK